VLRELNPRSYVGLAAKLVDQFAPPAKGSDSAAAKKARDLEVAPALKRKLRFD
jgi:hypothetical protein